jgi:prolipoprotein diacylglyceryltransferase
MEKIAFIYGETFLYWGTLILTLAAVAAIALYAALYVKKGGSALSLTAGVMLSAVIGIPLSRLIHWYCRAASYESLRVAMMDYSTGGYALMGVFIACLLAAVLLRVLRLCDNLPRMLDCMAIGGGAGIAIGRLACLFNSADRGMILPEEWGFPVTAPVINGVSGAVENRLATFMIQSMLTAAIVLALLLFMGWKALRKRRIPEGDVCLLFLLMYGAGQVICDSTRYDSLFFRSNGFVSIVQILSTVALTVPILIFSVRMVRRRGFRFWQPALWVGILGMMGAAGYMEYYVQRHGTEAFFAYSVMGLALTVIVVLSLVIRLLGNGKQAKA